MSTGPDWLNLYQDRVEKMLDVGRKVMQEVIQEYKPFLVVAAYSGGNDSVVSTHFAVSEYNAPVLHCGTGVGLQACRDHVNRTAQARGWELHVKEAQPQGCPKRHPDGRPFDPTTLPNGRWTDAVTSYEEMVLNFGFPGPATHHRMYQRLKERPLREFVSEAKIGQKRSRTILIVSGIRSDESAVRAGYRACYRKERKSSRVWVNPFYYTEAVDFEAYRQEFGLPRNPVKDRIGISGECCCGAFAKPGELELVRQVDPGMARYLDRLGERVEANGFPWRWGERPPAWFTDAQRGQGFLAGLEPPGFRPMCIGCNRRGG